jgi:hypothetical protein
VIKAVGQEHGTPETLILDARQTVTSMKRFIKDKDILRGVSARANVIWTVVHQGGAKTAAEIPLYRDPKWADGYDVVVHNECFADDKDPAWCERILKPHREGKPAVLIHCTMHCYRVGTDAWFEFCGVQSPGHGPHYAYTVDNKAPQHPIMKGFGDSWTVPAGELYFIPRVFPTATPLATAAGGEPPGLSHDFTHGRSLHRCG